MLPTNQSNVDNAGRITASAESDNRAEKAEPGTTIGRTALHRALRLAEQAVNDAAARLRATEQERDDLARRLGDKQRQVDALTGEMNHRTALVRDLLAAHDHS